MSLVENQLITQKTELGVDFDRKKFESVFSKKVKAGRRRTYFFDVRKTKGSDYYLTITESTKRFEREGYERHKLFLYKEDFNRFLEGLEQTINHVKTELLPDYDYDEYTRRHEEYEAKRAMEAAEAEANSESEVEEIAEEASASENNVPEAEEAVEEVSETDSNPEPVEVKSEEEEYDADNDEDIKW